MDDGNSITVKLLTLLNVSATKLGKRKREFDTFVPAEKLNKRKSISFVDQTKSPPDEEAPSAADQADQQEVVEKEAEGDVPEEDDVEDIPLVNDSYESHFGPKPAGLSESSRSAVDAKSWKTAREAIGKLGSASVSIPQNSESATQSCTTEIDVLDNLKKPFTTRQSKQAKRYTELQNDILSTLSTRKDLFITSTPLDSKRSTREAIALHALNHVTKKRRRVLKNNERITKAQKTEPPSDPPEDVQDQGFTRPSVLVLLPFRSSALEWFRAITSHTPLPSYQIENQSRFLSEYGLPDGVTDKLVAAEPGTYPPDHVDTFKGNVDDNFRVGIKLTRKTVKMFSDFYKADIIIASPLGLRRSIDKEKNADYLTSIEVLIIDQMDALTMQNWDHVKFVLDHVNKLPKEAHDSDFSRIKPWYLDGHAPYLRQSILLSAYETPETRSLYNSHLKNVAGKIRTEKRYPPIQVPAGISQSFVHFDCTSPIDEPDKRFHHFTTVVLPAILKSAVQSANTIVFIPSSFDFIRVQNHFRKLGGGVTYSILSEYSSNQDISRARQSFFTSTTSFLLVSERFHFYKRYKIRGARNILFYGPPDHPQFFTEYLSYPFLEDGIVPEDVTCKVLHSKYDRMRLERIVGSDGVGELLGSAL